MPPSKQAIMARQLRRQGFNKSRVRIAYGTVKVGCSQCEAMVVNGIPIHERGCPNEKKSR